MGLDDFALGGLRLAVVTTDARGAALCPSLQCWWERLNVSIQATDAVDVGQGFGSTPDYDRLSYRN